MKKLKQGFEFHGELHEIHLVNFSVDVAEIRDLLPAPLKPRLVNGRAMISMVDVHLRNMRMKSKWMPFRFNYQHIAFRLLVEDGNWNSDHTHHGIYFLQSFTNRPLIAFGGNLLSNYNLQVAELVNSPAGLDLKFENKHLHYDLSGPILSPDEKLLSLKNTLGGIDRAWAVEGQNLQKTQIVREKWPLVPMRCNRFETNFFETARLEGVFKVPETIFYTWLAPENVVQLLEPELIGLPASIRLAHV